MFYDRVKIWVEAGAGGDGCISFRREAHVPRGGPDGGDGGHGGRVVLVCDPSRRDLGSIRSRHYRAGRGSHGQGANKAGARGDDLEIPVPPGTRATSVGGDRIDLTEPGQTAVLAKGGRGGRGNRRFATSVRQAPRFSEKGSSGESGWIDLTLALLADAGLVGLPNAGKSSLLAALTRARPKVADYPFTTLEPVLGTIEADDRQVVVADIPGLIEGAAEGAGLGHEFLAHVERCAMLVHVVEPEPAEGTPEDAYTAIRAELAGYGVGLADLPELIVLSKADLIGTEQAEQTAAALLSLAGDGCLGSVIVSSATGSGLGDLSRRILSSVPERAGPMPEALLDRDSIGFEADHMVYRPAGEGGYSVEMEEEGVFRINGRGVEVLFERFDLGNEEALAYLEGRLREIGVMAALERAGFSSGDEIRVGELEFELH